MDVVERISALVAPVVTEEGLELVEIEHGGGLLRITLDREGGIDLEAITTASERISTLLDIDDPIPGGRYTLEVSSPGLERALRTPEQFSRFVGTPVQVRTQPDVEGDRRVAGVLEHADDEGVVIAGRRLSYRDIERARTVFEWGPAPKPGKTKKKNKKAVTS